MGAMHVLGIDAGGTKTVCLLADAQGAIVAEGRGPGANLHNISNGWRRPVLVPILS